MARECYKVGAASTIGNMGRGAKSSGSPEQNELYPSAVAECVLPVFLLLAGVGGDRDQAPRQAGGLNYSRRSMKSAAIVDGGMRHDDHKRPNEDSSSERSLLDENVH
jgi:hypothetical protein